MESLVAVGLLSMAGYVVGSIPFGVVVSRLLGAPDPRQAGSRNVGFTNVLRVGGKQAGVLTLVGDLGKGWLMVWIATKTLSSEGAVLLVSLAVVLGHLYSVFLGFKGGKGVATAFGVILGLHFILGLVLVGLWLVVVGVWRYSSGGALVAFGLFPLLAAWVYPSRLWVAFAVLISALIWIRHKENVGRLWSGTETRIGQRKPL